MNQEVIGSFIAKCRKEKGLTQMQLAEKLNITNRAVSKWETGKSIPDISVMPELCEIFDIQCHLDKVFYDENSISYAVMH